jgi:putative ABC transport system permease protein
MQILRFALRNLWRDLKSGELSVLLLALCGGRAVVDGRRLLHQPHLAGSARAGGRGAGGRSAIGVSRPHPGAVFFRAQSARAQERENADFPTAIFNGDVSQLAALNAVTASYPLRGRMRIAGYALRNRAASPTVFPMPGRGVVDARIIAHLKSPGSGRLRIGAGIVSR